MSTGFVKLYGTILTSSIWLEDDATLRLWIAMLALCDKHGQVAGSVGGLAHTARLSRKKCEAALETLSAPDSDSRTLTNEGRRIEKINGGWLVLNHQLYRDQRSYEEGDTCYVYYAVAGNQVKIGTSKNPWARARELRTGRPEIVIAAVERGGRELESERHRQFAGSWLNAEWFSLSPEISEHMGILQGDPIPEQPVRRTPQHPHKRRSAAVATVGSVVDNVATPVVNPATLVATVELPDTEADAKAYTETTKTSPSTREEIQAISQCFPNPAAAAPMLVGMTQGLGTPGMKAVPVEILTEAMGELRTSGGEITPHRFKAFVRKVLDRQSRESEPSRNGAIRGKGSTTRALKLIGLIRGRRNPMHPNSVLPEWKEGLEESEAEVCRSFGLTRILNDQNEGTVVAQLARALEESVA